MGVGFGVGASVGEGRCGAVDLSVELPEEPELLPVCGSVVSGTAAGAGSCVGFGVGSGVGDGVGEGVGVGTSSRRMIVTGVDSGDAEGSASSDSNSTASGERPLRLTSTTCQMIPPTTKSMMAAPISRTFDLLFMVHPFYVDLQECPPGL